MGGEGGGEGGRGRGGRGRGGEGEGGGGKIEQTESLVCVTALYIFYHQ